MNIRNVIATGALLSAATLVLAGCGASAGGSETEAAPEISTGSLDELIEAAQAEGSVSVYGELQEPDLQRFAEGFTEKYGIEVSTLRLGGNSLAQRFEAEKQAKSPTADVLMGLDLEFYRDVIDKDLVVSFDDSGVHDLLEGYPDEYSFEEFGVPMLQTLATGFIYNTDLVDPADIPDSWQELVDSERWQGKFCSVDPNTSISVVTFYSVVAENEGEDVVRGLGEKMARWYPNIVALNEAVAVGECELGIDSAQFFVEGMKAAGNATVEFAAAPTALYPSPTAVVVQDAAHPNAARLFVHYVLSEEGNRLLNTPEGGSFGPWDGDRIPEDFWVPTIEQRQTWRAQSDDIAELLGL